MTNTNNVPGPGEPQGPPSVPPAVGPGQTGGGISRDARMWAMFCHLAALATFVIPLVGLVVGPLVVWLIKKELYPFVDEQGKEAVNFQISMLIGFAVGTVLLFACDVGILVISIFGILDLVFMIIAAIKANDGFHYRYPWSITFIK